MAKSVGANSAESSDAPSVGVIAQLFLDHCRAAKGLSDNTLRAYAADLRDFLLRGCDVNQVASISRDLMRRYAHSLLDERRLKETTTKRRLATLKVFFRWMEREELVPLSVFHRMDLSVRLPRRLPRALSASEMVLLLRAARAKPRPSRSESRYNAQLFYFVVVALFATGLRVGELVSVSLGEVCSQDGTIQVRGKGNRERRVYVTGREASAVLDRYLAARRTIATSLDRLLVAADGSAVTTQRVRRHLGALGRRAGLPRRVTPHMLRHTAATQLLEAGVDIRFVQRLLGHTSIATTQIYTEVRDVALREELARADTLSRLHQSD